MTKNLIISRLDENVYSILRQNVSTVEEFKNYLEEIVTYGCASGCVSQLITTKDCEYFVKENLADILILMDEAVNDGLLESMSTDISLIAWQTVEITAMQLLNTIDWNYMLNERTIEATITEEEE